MGKYLTLTLKILSCYAFHCFIFFLLMLMLKIFLLSYRIHPQLSLVITIMNCTLALSTSLGNLVTSPLLSQLMSLPLHRVSETLRNLSWFYAYGSHPLAGTWLLRGAFPVFWQIPVRMFWLPNLKINLFLFFNWPDLIWVYLKRGRL